MSRSMAERPDLRQIAENIEEALSGYDRDALLEMLTYVFKEYVLEGTPPVLVSQVDGIDGLEGLTFPQLIETLQSRLDLPELDLLQVSGEQVLVRVGGALTPLDPGDAAARPPMPIGAPPSPAPDPLPTDRGGGGRAAADEAERRGRGDLAGGRRGVVQAPPPRGVSVSSRPSSAAPPEPAPQPPAPPAAEPEPPEAEPEGPGDDDASVRFSLLELD